LTKNLKGTLERKASIGSKIRYCRYTGMIRPEIKITMKSCI
jgi:hypothetical protein